MSPLNAAICTTISYTLWVEWYYIKNNYLTLRSKVKVPWRSLWYATHRLMVMHPHTNYHWPISKDKNVNAWTRKYYFKNNYLTLRSKVEVPRRSLRYVTQHLMVMHIRTICPWTVLLDLFELFDLEVKGQGPTKVIMVCDIPPYGHAPTYQLTLTYLERQKCYGLDKKILFKKQLFDLEVKVPRRSLWYATHHLMVMHPHTKYHWLISKDKKVMIWTSFAEKKRKKRKKKSD
jgi:hypothetical protein